MSIIVCHPAEYGCIESSLRRQSESPINVAWPGNVLLDLPQSVIDLDNGLIRPSESRNCTWCLQEDHRAINCPAMKVAISSLPSTDNGIFRCKKCGMMNNHPTAICSTDESYGYSRPAVSSGSSSTSWLKNVKCHGCGIYGHQVRQCKTQVCPMCNEIGHSYLDCPKYD